MSNINSDPARRKFLQILVVDDEQIIHRTLGDYLRDSGHAVHNARDGSSALKAVQSRNYDLALVDLKMPKMDGMALLDRLQGTCPEMPVVVITGHGSMEAVIQALRLGAADFLVKPIKLIEIDAVIEKCLHIGLLRKEKRHLQETVGAIQNSYDFHSGGRVIIGASLAIKKVQTQIRQAIEAGCDTILVTGDTGTGKEVVARNLHFQAESTKSPFIAVSCPAIPESLMESEVFGHVRGAFTGALHNKPGYFELADGGTLFLDEITDLSAAAQAKLLRVLETRTLRRVGGSEEIRVDVRVITSTNSSLEEAVQTGRFRKDLYYRLNVFSIYLPPLRERPEDILPLAGHFLSGYVQARNLQIEGFSPEVEEQLLSYQFPGNVRELRNIIERAAILCRSGRIRTEHMGLRKMAGSQLTSGPVHGEDERSRILKALEAVKWNRLKAAGALNMPYSTFRYKLKKFQIE